MSALTPIPTRAGVTPKPTPRDPAAVVQRAWSILRLTRLQELVRLTIAELESFPQPEPIELAPADASQPSRPSSPLPVPSKLLSQTSPAEDALQICCEELREASGMSGAGSEHIEHCRAVREYMLQHPTWSLAFTRALEDYRRTAAVALEANVARAAAA